MSDFTETFWLGVIGAVIGFLSLTLKMCLKSKCDTIELCGLKIHRNVEVEEKLDKMELNQQPQPVGNRVLL